MRYRGIHDNWTDEGTGRPVNRKENVKHNEE